MIKLFIADDHLLFRSAIRQTLETEPDFKILGEASNGSELLETLRKMQEHPDIILLDLQMPLMGGFEAFSNLAREFDHIRVIVLSMHDNQAHITEMVRLGVSSYLDKNTEPQELFNVIRSVHQHGSFFTTKITAAILNVAHTKDQPYTKAVRQVFSVSDLPQVDIAIIKLICEEKTNDEIAAELCLSRRTIEAKRQKILLKLNVKNSAGIVKFAFANNLIDMKDASF